MASTLDGQALSVGESNLAGVMRAARAVLEPAGRIVVEVVIDDQPVTPEELAQAQDVSVVGRKIVLASADPRELAADALEAAHRQLDAAQTDLIAASQLIQQDRASEGMKKLSEALEVWQNTQQAVVQSAALLKIDVQTLTAGEQSAESLFTQTADRIRQLRELVTASDLLGLADTLAYEWPETTRAWQVMIDTLLKRIDA
jgi:hypothetical protein